MDFAEPKRALFKNDVRMSLKNTFFGYIYW